MNKEQLTYVIIGIVAVIIIIFLINSNQPKQEITSPPILTLPLVNTEISNLINIYDISNDSILKQITSAPVSTTTRTPVSTTTRTPVSTTTLTPISTTTQTPTTTLTPAQRSLLDFEKKQAENEKKLKEQKQKEEDDLFNTPLIPVFDNKDDIAYSPTEGFYQIRQFCEFIIPFFHPCYDIGPPIYGVSAGYLWGGKLGSLLDNNNSTGVVSSEHCKQKCVDVYQRFCNEISRGKLNFDSYEKSPLIIITMPILKTFTGKLKITCNVPTLYANSNTIIPNFRIKTYDNIFNDTFRNLDNMLKTSPLDYRVIDEYSWHLRSLYIPLETVNLKNINNLDSTRSAYWDLNFTKPFRCIIFELINCSQQGGLWITSINFEKSR